jgi:hypothetical protein
MNRKNLILGLGCVLLLAGSVAVMAGIGGGDGTSDIDINTDRPGGGGSCVCTQQYDPVVCIDKNPDGTYTKQEFSNACFASCAGFTNCFGAVTIS